jgi:hypothetical protein
MSSIDEFEANLNADEGKLPLPSMSAQVPSTPKPSRLNIQSTNQPKLVVEDAKVAETITMTKQDLDAYVQDAIRRVLTQAVPQAVPKPVDRKDSNPPSSAGPELEGVVVKPPFERKIVGEAGKGVDKITAMDYSEKAIVVFCNAKWQKENHDNVLKAGGFWADKLKRGTKPDAPIGGGYIFSKTRSVISARWLNRMFGKDIIAASAQPQDDDAELTIT